MIIKDYSEIIQLIIDFSLALEKNDFETIKKYVNDINTKIELPGDKNVIYNAILNKYDKILTINDEAHEIIKYLIKNLSMIQNKDIELIKVELIIISKRPQTEQEEYLINNGLNIFNYINADTYIDENLYAVFRILLRTTYNNKMFDLMTQIKNKIKGLE